MTFLVAWRLVFLAVVAAFTVAWLLLIFRRRRDIVRFTDVALLDVVAPDRSTWRRHVPAALWLLAASLLVTGFARPAREVTVPKEGALVVVAMDVSLSMEADDVSPTRVDAAKQAAVEFVEGLPEEVDVGVVLFSGTVDAYALTEDREAVTGTLTGARLDEGTAIGDAMTKGLELIETATQTSEAEPPEDLGEGIEDSGSGGDEGGGDEDAAPARIVVLSDGETTQGRPDDEAADEAADAGVRVDTIAFGTPEGVIDVDGVSQPVPVSPDPLRATAETTGGSFYEADSLGGLSDAYEEIGSESYGEVTEERDISGWFLGIGLLLLAVAGGLSLRWSQRLP